MTTQILFKFVKMDLTQFATFEDGYNDEDTLFDIFNKFQFAYNFTEHLVLCKTIVEVTKHEKMLLKADLDCIFQIDSESAPMIESSEEAVIPQGLLALFASLAYGTLRGAIYFKATGTPFSNFILPPNDVASAFSEPQIFKRNTLSR